MALAHVWIESIAAAVKRIYTVTTKGCLALLAFFAFLKDLESDLANEIVFEIFLGWLTWAELDIHYLIILHLIHYFELLLYLWLLELLWLDVIFWLVLRLFFGFRLLLLFIFKLFDSFVLFKHLALAGGLSWCCLKVAYIWDLRVYWIWLQLC